MPQKDRRYTPVYVAGVFVFGSRSVFTVTLGNVSN
jgi:hypothetical protein